MTEYTLKEYRPVKDLPVVNTKLVYFGQIPFLPELFEFYLIQQRRERRTVG